MSGGDRPAMPDPSALEAQVQAWLRARVPHNPACGISHECPCNCGYEQRVAADVLALAERCARAGAMAAWGNITESAVASSVTRALAEEPT